MISAIEFGEQHESCEEAMEWRKSLGPGATQADAWRLCPRGDWLLWQFEKLSDSVRHENKKAVQRAVECIVFRALRRGQRSLRGVRTPWATAWRRWARRWIDGSNRSVKEAESMAEAAVMDMAWVASDAAWAATAAAEAEEGCGWNAAAWALDAAVGKREWGADGVAEFKLQVRDVHRELPEWPGEEQP